MDSRHTSVLFIYLHLSIYGIDSKSFSPYPQCAGTASIFLNKFYRKRSSTLTCIFTQKNLNTFGSGLIKIYYK